ncbi:hypothetical protein BKA69DRAFT_879066 [Paraphysoderma sedebokerense]|nr:hypothetical protein BKA69DRAFT_879066 [Paraphysoderma sedebokerense]
MGAFNFVKQIIEACRWIVSVPLVGECLAGCFPLVRVDCGVLTPIDNPVIQELEGLSNSTEPMKANHAQEALGYISLIFSSQNSGSFVTSINPNTLLTLRKKKLVRLQTAQGNFLYDLKMTSESYGMSMNADGKEVKWSLDDVVLKCCEVLGGVGQSDQVRQNGEGARHNRDKIQTITSTSKEKRKVKALLVTNDLNLKLKARIKGVEVVGVKELRMIVKPQLE